MENEIMKAAEVLGLSIEETREKLLEIATQNSLSPDLEADKPLLRGLFRQWFGQAKRANATPTKSNSLVNTGFGVIIGIEDCRDMMEYQRKQLQGEYQRNSDETYRQGKVAMVTETTAGYEVKQWLNDEEKSRPKPNAWTVPESAIKVDDGWIIPVDSRPSFGSGDVNKNYGKPLPLEQWTRRIHFMGEVTPLNISTQYWTLSLKNDMAKEFNADCFRFCHVTGIWNEERNAMYGVWNQPVLQYNDDLNPNDDNYRDTTSLNVQDLLGDTMDDYITPLIDLERYHQNTATLPTSQRMVVTDGIVTNMILKPNSTGNRTIFISDLSAEFDYDSEQNSSIACWVPPHINLDFGIGSNIIIMGRSNQREVDGALTSVSLNTFGIMVIDQRGESPSFDEVTVDDSDWF
tara:strand:- start:1834 stop:3045 length:1212 start_codon:yes stop_codon:yes gene_type:complete